MKSLLQKKKMLSVVAMLCTGAIVAQVDTLALDVNTAEQQLVSNSLLLLATKYNVDISKSEVTQAKAWYNPNISYLQTLYDPASGQYFDNSKATGQVDVQITQLFSIAGRHINAVRLAQLDVQRSQLSFDELSLSLKYEMYSDIADLYEAQQADALYSTEVDALDKLIVAAVTEMKLGATPGNEVIRLKAERQSTIIDKLANANHIDEIESDLRILLGYPQNKWLKIVVLPLPSSSPPTLSFLLQNTVKRPDVQLAATDLQWNQRNLRLQKSIGVPDLLLGTEYDRRSSYDLNLWSINAGMDIPIFNRNQGNIRAAKFAVKQAQVNDTLQQATASSEVVSAFSQYLRIRNVRDSVYAQPGVISADSSGKNRGSYAADLDLLFHNAVINYSTQRIRLIEFLDELRTYDDARHDLITLDADLFRSAQQVNFAAGINAIH